MNIRSKDRHSLYASIGTITDDGSYHALAVPTKGIRICKLPPWVGSLTPREKILASSGDARLLGRALLSPSLRQEKCHYTRYIIDRSSVSISTICSGCQLNVEAHPYRFVFETTCRHRVTPIDLFWYERVPQEEFRTGESN